MSSSSIAIQLLVVAEKYTLSVNYIVFITGLIGSILNILVFTNLKLFRGNRCAFYLITESIISIIILINYFTPQMVQMRNGIDPTTISRFYCKIKTPLGQWFRVLFDSIVCFEALDQFLSTNHRPYLRKMSTIKLARYLIFTATVLCALQTIPYIIFSDIIPPSGCVITSGALKNYYSFFYYIILNGLLPILISSVFSILAYRNVRRIVRRQIPIERRRLDHQLTAMIFVRVMIYVILSLPYTIFRIYILNANVFAAASFPFAVRQLITAIFTSFIIWIYSLNFYVFLAISTRFRRQVKYFFIKKCWQSLKQWWNSNRNQILPLGTNSIESVIELE